MFKQFLQLDLNHPHDKQAYSLKRNALLLKNPTQTVKFDAIVYTSDDIITKITYELITLSSKSKQPINATITFNYSVQIEDLILLMDKLINQKMFCSNDFRVGHFQVRNGHISDYNKNCAEQVSKAGQQQLNEFQKDMDGSLKLQKIWKINQYLIYQQLTPSNTKSEMTKNVKKFGKRTNEFYVLQIAPQLRIIIIILPRSKQFVFTKQQSQQIEQLYVLNKNALQHNRQNICFTTPIAQIINNYLEHATLNMFVSAFPQNQKDLQEVLKLPIRLGNPQQQEIKQILQSYSKDKWTQLQLQGQKMKKKLRDLQYNVKNQQDNMQRLVKVYSKTFAKTFNSIQYLKSRSIKNVGEYIAWLKQEIDRKDKEVQSEEAVLKDIHRQMIADEERHLFYLNKLKRFKQRQASNNAVRISIKEQATRQQAVSTCKQQIEPTQQELMYLYDPQKEMNRYTQISEGELKARLSIAPQRAAFLSMLQEVRHKLNKTDFSKIEQDFYDLIPS